MNGQNDPPGSQSLPPFTGKRSRDPSDSGEEARSNDGRGDPGREKRAKTPGAFGFGLLNGTVTADDLPTFPGSERASTFSGSPLPHDQTAHVSIFPVQKRDILTDGANIGLDQGVGGNGFSAQDSMLGLGATNIKSLGNATSNSVPEIAMNGANWLNYKDTSNQSPFCLHTTDFDAGITVGQEASPESIGLRDSNLAPSPAFDANNVEQIVPDPEPVGRFDKYPEHFDKDKLSTSSIQSETPGLSVERVSAEEVEYDTCFGTVCSCPHRMYITWYEMLTKVMAQD